MGKVGVVSIQGDFEKHCIAFEECGVTPNQIVRVRTPEELTTVDRAVIPGGESTTVGLLMQRFGLGAALQKAASEGMPIWGTCMGMILMSQRIEGRPDQYNLGLLDITIRRNAFGAQVHSFEDEVSMAGFDEPVLGVFIRAPMILDAGEGVQILAHYQERAVAARSGNLIGTSFHPELTSDRRLHEWFLNLS